MKKTYAVIGLGRFGTAVAERLYALGNEVLVIDDDAERVQRMESRVTYAVVADARDEAVLRSLGMRNYDCAIVAIGTDLAASIVITMNLKELGVPQVVCKAEGDMQKRALEKIGADKVLIPEREAGVKLAQAVTSMEERLGDIDHIRQQIVNGFDTLGGMWEGRAHDTFQAQYQEDDQLLQMLCQDIRMILSDMASARREYDRCEEQVRDSIARIRI